MLFQLFECTIAGCAGPIATIILILTSMMIISAGVAISVPNALSLALEDYRHNIDTASSLFGFYYLRIQIKV